MARYKVSNKNFYGFKSGMFLTMGICILVVMAAALVVDLLIAPLFYGGYAKEDTLAEGVVGSASSAQTPLAGSIADMEQLSEGFTLYSDGAVLNNDRIQVGGTAYHFITLDSGEKVAARINLKTLTKMGGVVGYYRLPLGVWREWDAPEELRRDASFTDLTHYIDMYGNQQAVAASAADRDAVGSSSVAWIFILFLLIFRVVGVRKWRFAPALLASRDPLLPRNDLECWCAATFAIWSHSFDGMEGFPLITGSRGTRKQVKSFRDSLAGQWDIHDREEGLRTVHELTDEWAGRLDASGAGWDLCRTTQLLGMMYLVGMLKRDELDREFSRAGRIIQRSFSSWDELVDSYLEGFRAWASRAGFDAEGNLAFRRGIYGRLKKQYFSPYSIPWDTDLSWPPDAGGERVVTKQLLKNYRDDF